DNSKTPSLPLQTLQEASVVGLLSRPSLPSTPSLESSSCMLVSFDGEAMPTSTTVTPTSTSGLTPPMSSDLVLTPSNTPMVELPLSIFHSAAETIFERPLVLAVCNLQAHHVPRPHAANIVGCNWIFRIKRKPDGTLERYKE
ncbi:hypothetical protein V2J09_006599, partial [Rumex salicifolius]